MITKKLLAKMLPSSCGPELLPATCRRTATHAPGGAAGPLSGAPSPSLALSCRCRLWAATVVAALALTWSVQASEMESQNYQGIEYMSGGIGDTEANAMREAASEFNLGMTFTARSGEYLSDVQVTVKDKGGKEVLSTVSDGPMLLVDLPAGRYTVEATFEGQTMKRQVAVTADKHRQLLLRWETAGA